MVFLLLNAAHWTTSTWTEMNMKAVLIISLLVYMALSGQTEYRLMCYVTSQTQLHPDVPSFRLDQVNPFLCTHIIYASTDVDPEYHLWPFSPEERTACSLIRRLRESNPDLKILLATGTWTSMTSRVLEMASDLESRRAFVQSAVQRLRQEGFDGLDLVWLTGAQMNDTLLTLLLKELQGAFQQEAGVSGRKTLLLSTALLGLEDQVPQAFDARSFSQYVDFISLIIYNLQKPVDKEPDLDQLVTYWLSQGVESQKLTLGFPVYAPGYWKNETYHLMEDTGIQRDTEQHTQMCHFMGISHSHHGHHLSGSHRHGHSLRGKLRHLRSLGVRAATVWFLGMDDPSGILCGHGSFPFTKLVRSFLIGSTHHRPHHHSPHRHRHHHRHHGSSAHGEHHHGHHHCHHHGVRHYRDSSGEHTASV